MANDTIWLTQEAYDALAAELEHLKTAGRTEISRKIGAARAEGDLSENGGYHAAREEQGQMEGRITQLEHMLREAQVGQAPVAADAAAVGSKITVAYAPDDTETFLLGSREMLTLRHEDDTQVYSPQSLLGGAVLGAHVGDTVGYTAPSGKAIELSIVAIEPFTD
ncbi:MAG: transcription elongation factor GreA [Actinomycetia bacterium]|nr:transcription elongation factor GreA [Actinomycetes bacterium]